MSTPTDQQRMRANLRKAMTNMGTERAAYMAIDQAGEILGDAAVIVAVCERLPVVGANGSATIPSLMGTAEVAAAFGIANSNISKLPESVRPSPVARISNGTTPVYLASEVTAKAAQYRPRTRA